MSEEQEQKDQIRRARLTARALGLVNAASTCDRMAQGVPTAAVQRFAEDLADELRRQANRFLAERDYGHRSDS